MVEHARVNAPINKHFVNVSSHFFPSNACMDIPPSIVRTPEPAKQATISASTISDRTRSLTRNRQISAKLETRLAMRPIP